MRVVEVLSEASTDTAVMAFGRMNPPTIGHAKLVDKVSSLPGDSYIFLSQSQKPKTDPLSFQDKLRYAKFFFPEVTIGNPEVKTIIQALQKISSMGYKNLIYVAGSDRIPSFEELINKYNGVEYNFDSIKVVSAGERDPDADGAEGMSASKMRAAAAAGDLESFKQGVPQPELADEMFAAVRKGMGIKENVRENTGPDTIKPVKVPQFPQVPQQDGDLGQGAQAVTNKDGTRSLYNDQGIFTWDKAGNPVTYDAPSIGGVKIKVDLKTGNQTVTYQKGPMTVSAVYDKTGKKMQGQDAADFDFGVAKVSTGPKGNSTEWRGFGPNTENVDERELTGGEKRSRESNVKKLKKHKGDFEKRYGKDAESVMYAVATKRAKGESVEEGILDDIKGAFDWSGSEFEKSYVPFARKYLNIHPTSKILQMMQKQFPDAQPIDLKRAIKFAAKGNY